MGIKCIVQKMMHLMSKFLFWKMTSLYFFGKTKMNPFTLGFKFHGNCNACWNGAIMVQFQWLQLLTPMTWNSIYPHVDCVQWMEKQCSNYMDNHFITNRRKSNIVVGTLTQISNPSKTWIVTKLFIIECSSKNSSMFHVFQNIHNFFFGQSYHYNF